MVSMPTSKLTPRRGRQPPVLPPPYNAGSRYIRTHFPLVRGRAVGSWAGGWGHRIMPFLWFELWMLQQKGRARKARKGANIFLLEVDDAYVPTASLRRVSPGIGLPFLVVVCFCFPVEGKKAIDARRSRPAGFYRVP